MRRLLLAPLLVLSACPPPVAPDGGEPADSGPPPPSCDSPEDCAVAGYGGVCRQGACAREVPCADDLECGLGESCVDRACTFTGCTGDADCPTGRCRLDTFTCAECGQDLDCPFNRPVCDPVGQQCVQCVSDSDCHQPGPAYCERVAGVCMHCLTADHCPNGLTCSGGTCAGARSGQACPMGVSCAEGLTCVNVGTSPTCLQSCNAFAPACPAGQICYTLKYSGSTSYVFDMGGLLGVCFTPQAGLRNYRDSCEIQPSGLSNCQPSLQCIPDSPETAACRSYCDPGATNPCPAPEVCHRFPGDFNGRQYGLCYADNGWGDLCTSDATCRAGQSCQASDDPADFDEVGFSCRFNVGTEPGLSPCGASVRPDGGVVTADSVCQSGACRGDTTTGPAYFCHAYCQTDDDCTLGGRTGTCDGTFEFAGGQTKFCRALGDQSTCELNGCFWDTLPAPPHCDYFPASERGCRPGCEARSDCDEYGFDGGLACRPRLLTSSTNTGLKLNCGAPNPTGLGAGAPCTANLQCYSNYCWLDDSRGVRRQGQCLEPCRVAADCALLPDAGDASGPLDCLPTTFLGYRGPDVVPGTPDDALSVRRVCSGVACNEDEDCSTDGGARCAPDVSPLDAGEYVLRCRPPAIGAMREAGTACATNAECASGACGQLGDGARVCFKACDVAGAAACPGGLTCQAGVFRFTTTLGTTVTLDGCAP